ncbi:MAG: DUF1684 domain-containing protein [Ignavibacteriales bacterium]|nr:MAG: DUF1684 domain-containing protein [Ignavibacteriales bacterium]
MKKLYVILFAVLIFAAGCEKNYSPEERDYINKIEKIRIDKNNEMKNDANSPFNLEPKVHFEELKYFDINPGFVFKSKLTEYPAKDTIKIYGTKGEERKVIRFGFVSFSYKNSNYKMNVYKGTSRTGVEYYSLWFTDKTTNEETYGVGRYLDFELNPDKDFIYSIDFNLAYNPYCAYSSKYSCAVPTKEDYLDLAIEAGEKKFHD